MEPQFEPGIWKNQTHDAILTLFYDGILECFHQGNALLGGIYTADMVSVHDPDEYLALAQKCTSSEEQYIKELQRRQQDIMDAYRALFDLKAQGLVKAVGIGAKDPVVIEFVTEELTRQIGLKLD
mmetsp:Transcript_9356/g.15407  ORF Transcript_9356/g.15407 Transcript_9356/m.15407 type:complete len:125 (+) Transcript_9356:276-650(+)